MLWVKDGNLFDGSIVYNGQRIWITGTPDPTLMLAAGYTEYDPVKEPPIAVSPFGFLFSDMTQTVDGYTITIPAFVVRVENDVTGTVICDVQHNPDGSSTLLFTDTDTEWFSESNSFTAYTITEANGAELPVRDKVQL